MPRRFGFGDIAPLGRDDKHTPFEAGKDVERRPAIGATRQDQHDLVDIAKRLDQRERTNRAAIERDRAPPADLGKTVVGRLLHHIAKAGVADAEIGEPGHFGAMSGTGIDQRDAETALQGVGRHVLGKFPAGLAVALIGKKQEMGSPHHEIGDEIVVAHQPGDIGAG